MCCPVGAHGPSAHPAWIHRQRAGDIKIRGYLSKALFAAPRWCFSDPYYALGRPKSGHIFIVCQGRTGKRRNRAPMARSRSGIGMRTRPKQCTSGSACWTRGGRSDDEMAGRYRSFNSEALRQLSRADTPREKPQSVCSAAYLRVQGSSSARCASYPGDTLARG